MDALLAPSAVAVPEVLIEHFRIPPFLLPIYQAAGVQYGVRWELLAAINEIETDYGRNVAVSSAGALGWMQFMPDTWARYGVDANRDGSRDPYNPVDAVFAAARYLKAAGAQTDVRRAIYAYNHADWYVDSVLVRAKLISALPPAFVGSLTGLTEGRFPVHAASSYGAPATGQQQPTEATITATPGAPVIAVQDGKVIDIGADGRRGAFIRLRDVYGNTYTYTHVGVIERTFEVGRPGSTTAAAARPRVHAGRGDLIAMAASVRARAHRPTGTAGPALRAPSGVIVPAVTATPDVAVLTAAARVRSANTAATVSGVSARSAPGAAPAAASTGSGVAASLPAGRLGLPHSPPTALAPLAVPPASETPEGQRPAQRDAPAADRGPSTYRPTQPLATASPGATLTHELVKGSLVPAGTVLGHLADAPHGSTSYLRFTIRPAGTGAPRIDPTAILDGWRLLESTSIYRAATGAGGALSGNVGQILLLGKDALQRRVLNDERVHVYPCGRADIAAGRIDRRVLAALEFLAASGLQPTVTALECGHGYLTASGNVSEHSSGNAVDIAAVNGVPILGHQGPGSITDVTIRRLLALQGTVRPHQIISLMQVPGADSTLSLPDHDDHIHVGFQPRFGDDPTLGRVTAEILSPGSWTQLARRLAALELPDVGTHASDVAIPVRTSRRRP